MHNINPKVIKIFIEWVFKVFNYILITSVFVYLAKITDSLILNATSYVLFAAFLTYTLLAFPWQHINKMRKKEYVNRRDMWLGFIAYLVTISFLLLVVESLSQVVELYADGKGL